MQGARRGQRRARSGVRGRLGQRTRPEAPRGRLAFLGKEKKATRRRPRAHTHAHTAMASCNDGGDSSASRSRGRRTCACGPAPQGDGVAVGTSYKKKTRATRAFGVGCGAGFFFSAARPGGLARALPCRPARQCVVLRLTPPTVGSAGATREAKVCGPRGQRRAQGAWRCAASTALRSALSPRTARADARLPPHCPRLGPGHDGAQHKLVHDPMTPSRRRDSP